MHAYFFSSLNNLFFCFCKFGTAGYEIVHRLFVLLIYSARWTGVILHNSFIVSLGWEVAILSCNYQSLHFCSQSCTSEALFGFANISVCLSYFLGYYAYNSFSFHCLNSIYFWPVALPSTFLIVHIFCTLPCRSFVFPILFAYFRYVEVGTIKSSI